MELKDVGAWFWWGKRDRVIILDGIESISSCNINKFLPIEIILDGIESYRSDVIRIAIRELIILDGIESKCCKSSSVTYLII